MNEKLLQVVRKLGLSQTLRELRDYCHEQGEQAFSYGGTGEGWYVMHDRIDEIIPHQTDEQLDGPERS